MKKKWKMKKIELHVKNSLSESIYKKNYNVSGKTNWKLGLFFAKRSWTSQHGEK